jgi:protein TonB
MKNKLLFLILLLLCITNIKIYGQATDSLPSVLNPEKKAEFIGGMNGWTKFLFTNVERDLLARKGAPRGSYKVIGNFLIDTLGQVSDIRIETDPGYDTAAEFTRLLTLSSKKWIPAYDHGKAVLFRNKQSLTLVKSF